MTRLHFVDFDVPMGARLFVYSSKNPNDIYGPYEGQGPTGSGDFWTPPIEGDEVTIEYFNPQPLLTFKLPFLITEVSHIFQDPLPVGSCHNDIPGAWASVAKAVGGLDFISGSDELFCTGTLLANQSGDFAPFFLTAEHCGITNSNAQTVRVWWFYDGAGQSLSSRPRSDETKWLAGRDRVAGSDFTLLQILGALPSGMTWSGWTTSMPGLFTAVVGIHHPSGSYKRISYGDIGTGCFGGSTCSNFLAVDWDNLGGGVTEPGSSGSGLWRDVSSNPQLVGQLLGGGSSCLNPISNDYYGRFDSTFNQISTYMSGTWSGSDDNLEQNDSRSAPYSVTGNSSYGNLVVKYSDEDWYRISVPSNATISFTANLEHNYGDIDLALYRAGDANPIATSASAADTETVQHTNSGSTSDYFLRVFLFRGVTYSSTRNTYNLSVSLQSATSISVGQGAPNSQLFINAFNRGSFSQFARLPPLNTVHRWDCTTCDPNNSSWGKGLIQDFNDINSGVHDALMMADTNTNLVAQIYGGMWDKFIQLGGLNYSSSTARMLGYPIADRNCSDFNASCFADSELVSPAPFNTSYHYQRFQGGALVQHRSGSRNGQTFEVHGPIRARWQTLGGPSSGSYGLPITDEYLSQGKRRSDFEGGSICYDPSTNQTQDGCSSATAYTIAVTASPSAGGSVSGAGNFSAGTSRTVTATANSGYTFTNWTEGGSAVSTSASYTFTLNRNRTLVANFSQNQTSYTISLNASPSSGGSVSGAGTFAAGSSRNVTATANSGYTFTNWTEGGGIVSTSASYTFTLNANRTLVANFSQQSGCGSTSIGMGQTLNGSLSTSDCIYPGTTKYYDLYSFSGIAGQQISASMNSSAFDTYLYLTNAAGQVLVEDNNSGPGTNSRIVGLSGFFTLPATGTYFLWPTSAANNLTGAYTISLSQCAFAISSSENTVAPGNGGGSFQMDTSSGCTWSAVSDSTSWLTTSSSGTGDGRVSYSFNANPSTNPRTGRITVGGRVSTITQIGLGGAGSVRFNSASYSANENGGNITITVTRSGGTETGTVQYATSNGSATAGSDYTATSGLLLFGHNEMSKTFVVPLIEDAVVEGNETINLTLHNQSLSFTIGNPNTATVTIIDNDVFLPPTANPATAITSNSFNANWSSSSGATGYRLDVSTSNTFNSFVSGYNNLDVGNITNRSVTGLSPNTTYFYRVRAYNSAGTSGNSNISSITTLGNIPPAPTANAATSVTSTSYTANWNSSSGATGYRLDVSTSSSFGSFVSGYNNLNVGNVLSRSVTGLAANTTYYYRVRAYNSNGTSGNSNTITVATPTPSLSAPTAISATSITSNSFTANWSSSSGATGYRLDVSTSSSFISFLSGYQNLDVGNVLSRSITGLTTSTLYYYRVRAYNGAGVSANSNTITVSTLGPMIFIEQGTTNRAAALDAITWLRGPFKVLNFFTPDNHTRVILFTSHLGLTQPDSSQLAVRAGGVTLTVEGVGPVTGVTGMNASYIIVRLPDGLPAGDLPLVITLRGLASVNSPTLAIASSGP